MTDANRATRELTTNWLFASGRSGLSELKGVIVMALPGFTAEASIGPTTQAYRLSDRYGIASEPQLYAQSYETEWDDALFDDAAEDEGMGDESFSDDDVSEDESEVIEDI